MKNYASFPERIIINSAIMIMLITFLFMISGCAYYKVSTKYNNNNSRHFLTDILNELYPEKKYPKDLVDQKTIEGTFFMEHNIWVIDNSGRWQLDKEKVNGDTIYADAVKVPELAADDKSAENRKSRRYIHATESYIVKRINFYIDSLYFNTDGIACIPISEIKKCDIYTGNPGKSVGVAIGTLFGLGVVVFGAMLIYAALTSCPFVYAFDGNSWQFVGEIYGGAVYPSLEREDYLAMPKYNMLPGSGYDIKIANLLHEVQYINMAEMLVLTHDSLVKPLIDKQGRIHTVKNPQLPYRAFDSKGTNRFGEIRLEDRKTYSFDEDLDTSGSSGYFNSLELSFRNSVKVDSAKLILNAKNSIWGDHMIREFFNLFGRKYDKFVRMMEDKEASYHLDWMQQQGLFIEVSVLKDGQWCKADYYNLVGALGDREMILPLDLRDAWTEVYSNGNIEYELGLKLVSGFKFWEVDYTAIDLSPDEEVGKIWLKPDVAFDQNGKELGELLQEDDDLYLIQNEIGDIATLEFTLPDSLDMHSSLWLHSKGYYQQADKNRDAPDITFLNTLTEPGQLSLWSYMKSLEEPTAYQIQTSGKDE